MIARHTVFLVLLLPMGLASSTALAQKVGPEFQINTYTTGPQGGGFGKAAQVASDANGNFVVVWTDGDYYGGQDGSQTGIFARRYASDGTPVSDEFQVNTFSTGEQTVPDIASDASGNFIVVWASEPQDGS